MPSDVEHTVTRTDDKRDSKDNRSKDFEVIRNMITLPRSKVSDSGTYDISCTADGMKGRTTFTVDIKPGKIHC